MPSAFAGLMGPDQKPSIASRLKAWWEGVELPPPRREEPRPLADFDRQKLPSVSLEEWETPAIKVKQAIWGEGYHRPGGDDLVLELVRPFALNNTMSVLDFGCGVGGSTRAIARAFDIWMTGVERDHSMVVAGKALSKRAGLERRAEIIGYDDKNLVSRPGGFDCVLSIEALWQHAQREIILSRLENALKTRGQLLITDFVLAQDAQPNDPLVANAFPAGAPALWSHVDYERRFKEMNIDLRVSEDMTARYRALAMACFMRIAETPISVSIARAMPEAFIAEIESWARRLAAIDSGRLRVRRFYGIKLGVSKMMSDWS